MTEKSDQTDSLRTEIFDILNNVLTKQDERLLSPILSNEKYKLTIYNNLYEDIALLIINHAESKIKEAKLFRRQFIFYETLLCELSKLSFAEGLLLILIEIGQDNSNDVFLFIRKPIEILLDSILVNRNTSIRWCLSMFEAKLKSLNVRNMNLEGDELKLLDLDESVELVNEMYNEAIQFFAFIIDKHYDEEIHTDCLCFLVNILSSPMIDADLELKDKGFCSNLRTTVEKIMLHIHKLIKNPITFYDLIEMNRNLTQSKSVLYEDEKLKKKIVFPIEEFPSKGMANYFYLLFTERMTDFPLVYSPSYLFVNNAQLSIHLISGFNYLCTRKGLLLLQTSLHMVSECLDREAIHQVKNVIELMSTLINVTIYNDMKSLRVLSLNDLLLFLDKLDLSVLYLVLIEIEPLLKVHSGIKSEIISKIIVKKLNFFEKNKTLCDLIRIYVGVSDDMDLIANKEVIMSSLSLVQFIVLNKKFSSFRERYFGLIRNRFLCVLRKMVELAKSDFKQFLVDVEKSKKDECEEFCSLSENKLCGSVFEDEMEGMLGEEDEECGKVDFSDEKVRSANNSLSVLDMIEFQLDNIPSHEHEMEKDA